MKNRYLKDSFSHAFNGLYQAFITERNVRLHYLLGIVAILLGFLFEIETYEWLSVVMVIGFVIVTELLNTAIEYTVDLVCRNTYNELAKYSKDIAAGATLLASVFAIIIGAIIFVPRILEVIRNMI